jgi:hypothetical protein
LAKVQVYDTFSLKNIPPRQAAGLFVREESYLVGEKVPGPCTFLLKQTSLEQSYNSQHSVTGRIPPEQQPVPDKQQEMMMPSWQASCNKTSLSIPPIAFTKRYVLLSPWVL